MINLDKMVNKLTFLILFIYLCATVAHQTWIGFDAIICKMSFALYFLLILINIFKKKKIIINNFIKWFVIFFCYIVISCLWSNNLSDATEYFSNYFLRIIILILGISNTIDNKNDIDKLLKMYVWAILYMFLILIIKTPSKDWGTYRLGTSIGLWKNSVGLYSTYACFFSIYFFSKEKNKLKKVIYILISGIFLYLATVSGSRKATLMIPLGVIIYLFLKQERKLTYKKVFRIVCSMIMIPIVLLVSYNFLMNNDFFYKAIGERIESGINVYLNDTQEESLDERQFFIKEATSLFKNNPIFGYGSNGFVTYMREINYSHIAYCHNNFLELLSTLGIIGFLIFYIFQGYLLFILFKLRNSEKDKDLYNMEISIFLLITLFGWWNVYYFQIVNNFLFLIFFLSSKTNCDVLNKSNDI